MMRAECNALIAWTAGIILLAAQIADGQVKRSRQGGLSASASSCALRASSQAWRSASISLWGPGLTPGMRGKKPAFTLSWAVAAIPARVLPWNPREQVMISRRGSPFACGFRYP